MAKRSTLTMQKFLPSRSRNPQLTDSSESDENMPKIESYPSFSKIAKRLRAAQKSSSTMSGKIAAVTAAAMLVSSPAYSLGLGVLDLNSNLDQPLNGTITVNVAPGDDVSTVEAIVASREEFEALGIDYPDYLKDIKLSVERSGAGAIIKVSSGTVVIKEPFIHFLVKVNWSGGNFVREYTALVDPPVYAAESPKSFARPKAVGTDQSYDVADDSNSYEESPALDVETVVEEVDSYSEENDVYESTPAVTNDAGVDGAGNDAKYGPVAAGESLSVIAQELQRQVPDLSIYSIMKVLHEDNPDAFINGNINGLIKGAVLTVRDINQIRATDSAEARRFFSAQVAAWDPSVLVASDSGLGVSQDSYTSDSELFGGTSDDSSSVVSEFESFQVGASDDSSRFLSAAQGSGSEGEVLALRQEITQLKTSLASSEAENQELAERVSLLEGQLADMNRLAALSLEDAELANLEANLAENNSDNSLANEFESIDSSELADDIVEGEIDTAESASNTLTTDDLLSEFLDDPSAVDPEAPSDGVEDSTDELAGSEPVVEIADNINQTEKTGESASAPITTTTPVVDNTSSANTESMLDKIGGVVPIASGLGAILLAGIAVFFVRRRRAADEEFEISMLSIESNSQSLDVDTDTGASASMSASSAVSSDLTASDGVNADKETSFLTVYSDSDAVVQADEVDPIAEADVYIAYGRDEQAEEVLLDGISTNPDRLDVKQKLLGLYFKNKNTEGFERIAEELFAQKDKIGGDQWQEISDMGKELLPDNPLFSMTASEIEAVETPQLDDGRGTDGVRSDLLAVDEKTDIPSSLDDESEMLVFDTVDETSEGAALALAEEAKDTVNEAASEMSELLADSLDVDESIQLINFDEGRSEISQLDEVEIDALAVQESDDGVLEFDLSDDAAVESDDGIELDLDSDLDLTAEISENDLVFDDVDLNEAASVDDQKNLSDVPEVSDLVIDPDYDEAQTQYELAKVFVDLGDEDGARKILDELVANDGNTEELRQKSKELLDSMG